MLKEFKMSQRNSEIIDSIIKGYALKNLRDLYAVFINYMKSFDSAPHSCSMPKGV